MDDRDVFELLAAAAIGADIGEDVAIGRDDEGLYRVIVFPGTPREDGAAFTADVFNTTGSYAIAQATITHTALNAEAKEADAHWQEQLEGLVPFVRHMPGCPVALGAEGSGAVCLCSLEGTLAELAEAGIRVTRCLGCGQHGVTPDGTEDWAWREGDGCAGIEPFCHECAVARGA